MAKDALLSDVLDQARALAPRTSTLRRRIHRTPELGLELPHTQAAVLADLADLPLLIRQGKELSSVVAVLEGARPGPTVLLRADMDALPITEDSGLDFSSTVEGKMHACGHDMHTAMLASAARLLSARQPDIAGRVVFMFQPGEESHAGAQQMLKEGLFSVTGSAPERALALHVTSTLPSGVIQCRPGPIMASSDSLRVTVIGRGGHACAPHNALDPIPAAAAIVGALQTIITRTVSTFDPTAVTVTRITAGTTNNIIPEKAYLEGTIRTLSEWTRNRVLQEVVRVCTSIAEAHGCQAQVDITRGYPVTINDDHISQQVLDLAKTILGDQYVEVMHNPLLGAEDFSYILKEIPGAMAFLGASPADQATDQVAPNHSNKVIFNEDALPHGIALYAGFALASVSSPN